MAKMQRFVGIRRGVLDHHRFARHLFSSETLFLVVITEEVQPETIGNEDIKEAFHHIELGDHRGFLHHLGTHLVGQLLGIAAGEFTEWKHHYGKVALKLRPCFLKIDLLRRRLLPV